MYTFPDSFEKKEHPNFPNAVQYLLIDPKTKNTLISIVGGGSRLCGDGINTFEMWDFKEKRPRSYLTKEQINEHLKNNY